MSENSQSLYIIQRRYFTWNGSKCRAGAAHLLKGVDPETRQTIHAVGEIHIAVFVKYPALAIIHDAVNHFQNLAAAQCGSAKTPHFTVYSYHRR
jgi:hypothetical protein